MIAVWVPTATSAVVPGAQPAIMALMGRTDLRR
jgi:hypothetical protein